MFKHQSIKLISGEIHFSPKIQIASLHLHIIPPNCNNDYQQEVLRSNNSLNTDCDTVLMGDFNCQNINRSTLSGTTPFQYPYVTKNFVQLVDKPIHCQGNTLVLIFTNSPHTLENIQVQSSGALIPPIRSLSYYSIHTIIPIPTSHNNCIHWIPFKLCQGW